VQSVHIAGVIEKREKGIANLFGMGTVGVSALEVQEPQIFRTRRLVDVRVLDRLIVWRGLQTFLAE